MLASKLVEVVGMIGKSAIYSGGGIKTKVVVADAKVAYGKAYYLIKTEVDKVGKWTTEDCIEALTCEKSKAVFNVIKEVLF
jgi:hypothetical protein